MLDASKPLKKGYKFPIYPNAEQRQQLEKVFGCCRYVYNRALAQSKAEYRFYTELRDKGEVMPSTRPSVDGYYFCSLLTAYCYDPESSWLREVSSVALQQTMLRLGGAYARFFREKKGYPNFKKKHGKQSFSLMRTGFGLNGNQLRLAKIEGTVKVAFSRELPSTPSSLTITRTLTGKYYVSFVCEYRPIKTAGVGIVGLDAGISALITTSAGEKIENLRATKRHAQKLRRAQQSLARKQKGSKNRTKARIRVAKVHERIRNVRQNHLHQHSRRLVNENQVIGMEALKVANMVKNRHLAKHIQDAAWGELRRILTYKVVESQHATLVLMDTYYPSSHLCSSTGERLDRKLTLSERSWVCPHCGQTHDRDVNAAVNIAKEAEQAANKHPYALRAGKILRANAYKA